MRPNPLVLLAAALLTACVPMHAGLSAAGPPGPTVLPPSEPAARPAGEPAVVHSADLDYLRERRIIVPVAGVQPSEIHDTFGDPRDDGARTHHAIDILAPRGTPILSADDGKVLRLSHNEAGGISLYTVDPEGRIVYYYAHLDHYRDGLVAGMTIAKGDTLGFVGSTGNATTPHLHFQVMRWPADGKYWYGEPINPYPLFREMADR